MSRFRLLMSPLTPHRWLVSIIKRWVSGLVLALLVATLALVAYSDGRIQEWWCARNAEDRLAELHGAATGVVGAHVKQTRTESSCKEGGSYYFVSLDVPELSRAEVRRIFVRDGWDADGGRMTSPDGRISVQYPRHKEPGSPWTVHVVATFI